jgi:5-dehydro-2-deoxygluconokinase
MGRVSVDLYPLQHGMQVDEVRSFEKFLGGTAANVAVAATRHGRRCALVSATADDAFGRFVHRQLLQLGVDDAYVRTMADGPPTPVAFCEIFPPDHFPVWFYRYPTAPDLLLTADTIPLDVIREARVFWTTGTGLSQEPSRAAHHAAWRARGRRTHTILDLDHHPSLWAHPTEAPEVLRRALGHVTVVVGNLEECAVATGEAEPESAARALLDAGPELAVVRLGASGALAMTPSDTVRVPAYPIHVVNGLGAGDAFGGALVHGLLEGWELDRTLHFASVASAVVAGRLESSTAMPTTAEVAAMLSDVEVAEGAI